MSRAPYPRRWSIFALWLISLALLAAGMTAGISIGAIPIKPLTVVQSLIVFDHSTEHLVVRTLRMPRTLMAALVGANLAVAGALMQAMTRNPLASPQIFGVNAGASLVIVAATVFWPGLAPGQLVYAAFAGAAIGGLLVYSFATSGGVTPVKLALVGMAVSMFLFSLTESLILFHEHTTESVLYWLTGAVDGGDWPKIRIVLPWTLAGLMLAFILSGSMTILGLGDDVARGLGEKLGLIRLAGGLTVIVLAGSAVAVAGPIGFVGLVVPHAARRLVGEDYRRVLPFSALLGALLLVYADIASRFIAFPFESPVGIVTALIGAPFFLYLARRGRRLNP